MNPTRPDAHPGSFKVNLDTGKWADFATGDNGGDLVTLYAYLYKLTHSEAARLLATELGVADYDHSPRRARSSKADWTPITPVPDNATPPPDLADGHLPQTLPAGGRAAPRAPAMRREREAENVRREAAAREKAVAIWQAAMTAPVDHPYLVKKGIKTHGLRVHDGARYPDARRRGAAQPAIHRPG